MQRTFYSSRGLGAEPASEKGVEETPAVARTQGPRDVLSRFLKASYKYQDDIHAKQQADIQARHKLKRRACFLEAMNQGAGKVRPFKIPPGINRQKTKKVGQYRISKIDVGGGSRWVVERNITAMSAKERTERHERRMKEDPRYAKLIKSINNRKPYMPKALLPSEMPDRPHPDDVKEMGKKTNERKKSGVNGLAGLFGLGSSPGWEVVAIAENESQAATLAEAAQDNVETLAPGEQATPSTDMATPGGGSRSPTEAIDEHPKVLGMKRNTALLVGGGLLAAFLMTRG